MLSSPLERMVSWLRTICPPSKSSPNAPTFCTMLRRGMTMSPCSISPAIVPTPIPEEMGLRAVVVFGADSAVLCMVADRFMFHLLRFVMPARLLLW